MEADFWHEKWELNHIGFHMSQPHPLLVKTLDQCKLSNHARLFLPLCGKTLDIAYLMKRGYQVVGVELSEIAIQTLFDELKLSPKVSKTKHFNVYEADNIQIFIGDFFDLDAEILKKIDMSYDRAALIALPENTRQRYSKHLTQITHNAPQLVINLEYDQALSKPPPFSVTNEELTRLYANDYSLHCLANEFNETGLKGKHPATENIWLLKK